MRPAAMPGRFHEALDRVGEHVARRGNPAEEAVLRQVAAIEPEVNAWCERLAALPGPPSLDHNDLHTWNVFLDGKGQAKFYDWGDSVVAHPFSSMLVALEFVKSRVLAVDADDPQILRLRDAYLEVFSDLAPQAELVETLELACRVGKIARALVWDRAVRALAPDEVDDEWARAPLVTLSSLLDDSYLGGA
jgi:Ser/Thr protein kinase RdoA (MazF antagonist)